MPQDPTLLCVGAGLLHCYTVHEAAHALGLRVITTDRDIHAPGSMLADEHYELDTYDVIGHRQLTQSLIRRHRIIGVCCCGGDAAPTVAAVATEAGLPGIPFCVAERTWDKWQVRYALFAAGLQRYQPRWCTGSVTTDMMTILDDLVPQVGFPCIMKPRMQRASRGVTIIDSPRDVVKAIACVTQYDTIFLLEQYLTGSEHSAEIILDVHGDLCHFHCCDRLFDYREGIALELGHINPSRLSLDQRSAIKTMLLESAKALGVSFGSWKCDVMWTDDGPKILECAARCSGGFDAQVSYPRSSGDNLLRRVIQVACGLPVTPQPVLTYDRFCAVAAIIPQKAGIVERLPDLGLDTEVLWLCKAGDTVQPPQHNAQRAGFVVVEDGAYDDAWHDARELAQAYSEALRDVTV